MYRQRSHNSIDATSFSDDDSGRLLRACNKFNTILSLSLLFISAYRGMSDYNDSEEIVGVVETALEPNDAVKRRCGIQHDQWQSRIRELCHHHQFLMA